MARRDPVHDAMRRIASALRDMGIPYAVAGAMALNSHGFRRTTSEVDVLLSREGLEAFKNRWLGRGWEEHFPRNKALRDTVADVRIDFLLAGGYPGDHKPKPVSFPNPSVAAEIREEEIAFLPLRELLELKMASGMTAEHRPGDTSDAMRLIKATNLPAGYGDKLDPYVRDEYARLWRLAQIDEDY